MRLYDAMYVPPLRYELRYAKEQEGVVLREQGPRVCVVWSPFVGR